MTKLRLLALLLVTGISLSTIACKNENKDNSQNGSEVSEIETSKKLDRLEVSENGRYFTTEENEPFFWLGDTGWLLFSKLNREESDKYIEDRKEKGFNVLQVMVLHSLDAVNIYGDTALVKKNVAEPVVTSGNNFENEEEYDYWDHIDYVVDKAAEAGIYMALVPVWGNNVKDGGVTKEEAKEYGKFLAERYKDRNNIIWLNGGDTFGNEYTDVWNALGETLNEYNPDKLITFHPRGRTQSSDWFHNESWLDFNMFQSGHRRYDQDDTEKGYGEDNWRYVEVDYNMTPTKPTIDGEPSYEGIPEGLHDPKEGFWDDDAVRRYAYWSVFAGAAGYTYGHSAVMQMHKEEGVVGAYGNEKLWTVALDDPGATQMKYLKELMLEFPYLERVPDQSMIANQGERYDYLVATRGEDYALVYTYNGREMEINMDKIAGNEVEASWYNPRTGEKTPIGTIENQGTHKFQPPGEKQDGNDWILILTSKP